MAHTKNMYLVIFSTIITKPLNWKNYYAHTLYLYFENMTQSDVKQALLYVVVNKNMTFCSDIANRDDD